MGTTIYLQHQRVARFFDAAMRPDPDELRQRDSFLAKLERECPVRIEGTDLIATIPDIDVAAFLGENK